MAMNARRLLDSLILEIGPCTFEHVGLHTFTYLGTKINKENNITEEVQNRIAVANVILASRSILNLVLYLER
jgi:hypothetical protein